MSASRRAVVVAAACMLTLLAVPGVGHADDDPRKKAAEATFQEGVRLHTQGRSEEGLAKLKKAYETYPSPNTLGGIARIEQALGRSLEALRHYREALRNPLMHPENAEHARSAIKELEKVLARVDVKGPSGLTVTIEDRAYTLPLAEPIDVKPETITLSASLGGTRYEGRATAVIGRTNVIEMTAPGAAGASAARAAAPVVAPEHPDVAPPSPEARPFWDTARVAGVALFGVGVAGISAGALFGTSSNDAADRANALQGKLGPSACAGAAAPRECVDLREARDDQDSGATLSTVFIVSGAVFATAGVAFFVWPRSTVRVTPSASAHGASLWLAGAF